MISVFFDAEELDQQSIPQQRPDAYYCIKDADET